MKFLPFVKFGQKDLLSDTPHLSLTIQATIELSLTLPYPIRFIIRRLAKGDATDSRPCIVRFNPAVDAFSSSGLVLLRHSLDSKGVPEVVPVDHAASDPINSRNGLSVAGNADDGGRFLWEFAAPGDEVSLTATLPERYYRALQGTKAADLLCAYTLLYPGAELGQWKWGTLQDHGRSGAGREAGSPGPTPRVVLPGGARVSFLARRFVGKYPWPERQAYETEHGFERANAAQKEWYEGKLEEERARLPRVHVKPDPPFAASDRVPGAPHFTVSIEGPATVRSYEAMTVQLVFTYHGVSGANGDIETSTARPVTFHSWSLIDERKVSTQLMRRRGGPEASWEASGFYEEDQCQWNIYDEPDVEVKIGQRHDDFASLRPGESWRWTEWLNSPTWMEIALPRDSMPGDMFRYRVLRSEVDWWDWGSMEDHMETVVKLPCYMKGDVTEPKDNGGRPKLLVPASEWFEFTLVE